MKKFVAVLALATMSAMAADYKGYIVDRDCANRLGMLGDVPCAMRCIARGAPAVLTTEDRQIYGIANQGKVKEFAGRKVKITGKANSGYITVDTIEEAK